MHEHSNTINMRLTLKLDLKMILTSLPKPRILILTNYNSIILKIHFATTQLTDSTRFDSTRVRIMLWLCMMSLYSDYCTINTYTTKLNTTRSPRSTYFQNSYNFKKIKLEVKSMHDRSPQQTISDEKKWIPTLGHSA